MKFELKIKSNEKNKLPLRKFDNDVKMWKQDLE